MRVGLKYITPVLAAGAAAMAIAAAPAALAESTPAQPATIATAPAAVAPNIVQIAGHGGGGFHGGGWGGEPGGRARGRGWGDRVRGGPERAKAVGRRVPLAGTPVRKGENAHPNTARARDP